MNRHDTEGLVVLFKGLAGGLGFVWLLGFAIGYKDPATPWVIATLAGVCLYVSFKIYKRGI